MTITHGNTYAAEWQADGSVSHAEAERLDRQARLFDPLARWTLDALELHPGQKVLELGCGGGQLLLAAAERVGPTGTVVGIDRDPHLLAVARHRTAEVPSIEVIAADAFEFDDGRRFDAVHCRNVLLHQSHPDGLIARMVALTNPGGHVAAQEYDTHGPTGAPMLPTSPPLRTLERLAHAVHTAVSRIGLDVQAGRKLPGRFRDSGLRDVKVGTQLVELTLTDPRITAFLDLWWDRGPLCEHTGVITTDQFEHLAAQVRSALTHPRYQHHVVRLPAMVAAVARSH
jgi:ubiquinone/menaquinone biosynthesis C-methylase UbiE